MTNLELENCRRQKVFCGEVKRPLEFSVLGHGMPGGSIEPLPFLAVMKGKGGAW